VRTFSLLSAFCLLLVISGFTFIGSQKISLPLECPSLLIGENPTKHIGYITSYNHQHEQANWVAYTLSPQKLMGVVERSNKFSPDPLITPETANTHDYTKSGFDRGHLAPAADMKYSETAMRECFYLSNISPQAPKFNRGIWKKLEEKVRDWASKTNQIFIVTGPILNNHLVNKIGREHQITVPEYFFKAVVDTNKMGNGIAFVMKNQGSQLPLKTFAITIDSLEHLTGRNFYFQIPQKKQEKIEKTVHLEHWDLND